jgi:hypothetical protein
MGNPFCGPQRKQIRRIVMKRIIGISLTLAVAGALLGLFPSSKHIVPVARAQSGCSVATLSGNYGFTGSGFASLNHSVKGAEVPVAYSGSETFDGVGNLSAVFTAANNGTISTGQTASGTYTVNSDCSGSASFTTGGTFNLVVVSGGAEFMVIQTDPGNTVTFDAKKQ